MNNGPPDGPAPQTRAKIRWMCGIVVSFAGNGHVQPVVSQIHL